MNIGPYNRAETATKSDTVNNGYFLSNGRLSDAIYVGGAGVVAAVFLDNTVVNFTCVAGQVLPVAIKRINDANTTATVTVALYRI